MTFGTIAYVVMMLLAMALATCSVIDENKNGTRKDFFSFNDKKMQITFRILFCTTVVLLFVARPSELGIGFPPSHFGDIMFNLLTASAGYGISVVMFALLFYFVDWIKN